MKQPRQGYWKPQHEVFIRCMLLYEDATKAYRAAYPKSSKASARIGGIRLNSYPHIRERIQPVIEKRHEEADRLAMEQALVRYHTIRTTIAAIARKEIKKNRQFIINGQTVTVQEDISHGALLGLLSLDLKLAEGYDNWPSIEREFERLTRNTSRRQQTTTSKLPSSDDEGPICEGASRSESGVVEKLKTYSKAEEKVILQNRQQTVINSPSTPIPVSLSANTTNPGKPPKTGNKNSSGNKFQYTRVRFGTAPPCRPALRLECTSALSLEERLTAYEDRHL